LAVEEDRTGKRIPGLALVEADLNPPAQLRIFHPLQHEKLALDAAHFAKRSVEAVLQYVFATRFLGLWFSLWIVA
jgi:hypothetical protein